LTGLEYVQGQPVTFQPGKVYIVEFWATWCPPCRASIPHLSELQARYKDKGVTIIGISDEDIGTVRPFVENMGEQMDYTVAVDKTGQVNENYMKAYNQNGIPCAFIVDGNGNVVWNGHPMGDMESVLDEVVAGTFDAENFAKEKARQEALAREIEDLYIKYFGQIQTSGPGTEATQVADQFIEKASAGHLNGFAWEILTRVEKEKRQVDVALKAAEKASAKMDGKDANILDTLALAQFENGQVSQAIATQEKAIELVDIDEMKAEFSKRLEKFKKAL
jgi:thiol-disulfide isomerase/thioredoxin